MLLAGDIGGTKTVLAVFSPEAGPRAPIAEATFPSGRYPSLEAIVQEFLRQGRQSIDRACFGVAGPVVHGASKITNLSWTVEEPRLAHVLGGARVRVVNDVEATASAVPILEPSDLHTLNAKPAAPEGAIAVIAPGTGLGEAFLTWDAGRYRAHPSEGGHADFAPRTATEQDLLASLASAGGHVSCELVCSGIGIPRIYAYLKDRGVAPEPPWLSAELAGGTDPTPAIVRAAVAHTPPAELARAALAEFVGILGAEAGNLALKVLATGGVYLGGGLPPRMLSLLGEGRFMRAFTDKGRLSNLLAAIPVHAIVRPDTALIGAACVGFALEA